MVEIVKVRPDGSSRPFFCDSQEYADAKIKSNPEMFMTLEDFAKTQEKKDKKKKKSEDGEE